MGSTLGGPHQRITRESSENGYRVATTSSIEPSARWFSSWVPALSGQEKLAPFPADSAKLRGAAACK